LNILILSTYPEDNPLNGGQSRVSKIKEYYINQNCHVDLIGINASLDYKKSLNFIPIPDEENLKKISKNFASITDYLIGELSVSNEELRKELFEKITFIPDLIQCEHPWFFKFSQYIQKEYFQDAKLVYSSHNNEHKLKASLLKDKIDKPLLNKIKNIEINAIKKADYIITVSEDNKNFIKKYNKKNIILAPNGASSFSRNKKKSLIPKKYCLFFGSEYQPNVEGFFKMFSGPFGSLNADQDLVIAGNVSYTIATDKRFTMNPNLVNRTKILGRLSRTELNQLINNSHCIVIPITKGDGTSLKTAEALVSENYVISTSEGMRGFNEFCGKKSGVYLANDAISFKKNIYEIMKLKKLKLTLNERVKRKKLYWEYCLTPLKKILL
tara:strand:- start:5356 stop:6504 length:1149 start_codon:yes stop_codon:yes gene_type:complete